MLVTTVVRIGHMALYGSVIDKGFTLYGSVTFNKIDFKANSSDSDKVVLIIFVVISGYQYHWILISCLWGHHRSCWNVAFMARKIQSLVSTYVHSAQSCSIVCQPLEWIPKWDIENKEMLQPLHNCLCDNVQIYDAMRLWVEHRGRHPSQSNGLVFQGMLFCFWVWNFIALIIDLIFFCTRMHCMYF